MNNISNKKNLRFARWRAFSANYPRLAWLIRLIIIVLIVANIILLLCLGFYYGELKALQTLTTQAEQQRIEALVLNEKNQLALSLEITKLLEKKDTSVHLAVDTQKGLMFLARENALLREMQVKIGKDAAIGASPNLVRLTAPRGKRLIVKVVDDTYPCVLSAWVYHQRGLQQPTGNVIPGALGTLAVVLDSGTYIYTRPKSGPLDDESYVLPGSIRLTTQDAKAIRKELRPGMVVYFY